MRRDRRLSAALALLSATLTAQQIALMQILGWMHGHHFAYMVVALALLGFGVSGTVLTLARERLLPRWPTLLPWLLLATAFTIPLGLLGAQLEFLAVDLPLIFFDPATHTWRLAALCLLLLPPFFCGGLATALLLTAHARQPGRFYAASLAGAGFGSLLGLGFVGLLAPPRLPAAVATLALLAALLVLRREPPVPTRPHRRGAFLRAAAFIATALLLVLTFVAPPTLPLSQFKPLRRTLDLPGARVMASQPSLHGWIQIVAAPALRPAPSVSFEFTGEIPVQPTVFLNGGGYGSLLDATAANDPHWLAFTTDAAAFLAPPSRVLLLENGPSGWAAFAQSRGARHIAVVEPNRRLVSLLAASTPPLAPEWRLPTVQLTASGARTFLRRSAHEFDLIRFPDVGALGGTAGLASTSEQFLLTREAFLDAWHRLRPGGVIAATAWMDFPERNPLRLLATLVETAEHAGVAPRAHLVALRGWAAVTFLLSNQPWNADQLAALRRFCDERGFDPLLLPGLDAAEREQHHAWQNPEFFTLVDRIVNSPRDDLYRRHPFALRPPTDDRPYFSQFLRPTKWRAVADAFGPTSLPLFELGSLTVTLTWVVLSTLALVGIALPLVRLGWRTPGKLSVLLYFGGLGAGFMFVEIGLILRAHAWLGSPIAAAAFVIATLLITAGAGSVASERLGAGVRPQSRALIVIAVAIAAAALLLAGLEPLARGWSTPAQIAMLFLLVAPLGTALGFAFPLGLRQLEAAAPNHVPWAWAINGCFSVATPAAATLLAMTAGFNSLFLAATAAYTAALLALHLPALRPPGKA